MSITTKTNKMEIHQPVRICGRYCHIVYLGQTAKGLEMVLDRMKQIRVGNESDDWIQMVDSRVIGAPK